MAYSAWTVTQGETPSIAKWNTLGTNDAYFNTQVGADFSSGTTSTVWYEELGRTTLGSTADSIEVASFGARKFLRVYIELLQSGAIQGFLTFNSDTGNNYSYRYSLSGAAEVTSTSTSSILAHSSASTDAIIMLDILNISSVEKLVYYSVSGQGASGAATAPTRYEGSGKWVNTSAQITTLKISNVAAGDYASGSQVVVMGHD